MLTPADVLHHRPTATGLLRVDGARLWRTLMELAQIGATPKGGVRRLALTDLDRQPLWRIRDSLEHRRRLFDHVVGLLAKTKGDKIAIASIMDPEACMVLQTEPFAWPIPPPPEPPNAPVVAPLETTPVARALQSKSSATAPEMTADPAPAVAKVLPKTE